MKPIVFYDSVKKTKEAFTPLDEKEVKVYVCGPTVYDDSHLGHARSAVAFDLLHRVLIANGYAVTMSKNFTDIDDKIINKMAQTNQTLEELTSFYISEYKKDMQCLNILPNTYEPKATENLNAMKAMIETLLKKDVAYIIEDGVYFDTSKDSSYGSLSHRLEDEQTQSRVETNTQKRNPKDFALWKIKKDESISYDAPFGKGRPGWHIECSAMIHQHLANDSSALYEIDIHGGGADLLFPHHENEAAQTRCATGKNLAKYWLHNGFVNVNGEKMSKSLGNSFFLKDILKEYSGEVIRFYLLTAHYRNDFNFNEEDLIASKKRLDKLYRVKKRVYGVEKSSVNKIFKEKLFEALNDDLNSAKAIALVDEMISAANEILDKEPKNKNIKKELVANIELVNNILGVGLEDAFSYFQFGIDEQTSLKIEELIQKRNLAKQQKEFQTADKIREELSLMGISLMDTPVKTVWEKL
ncbi:MAG: cysteine--tRNA ligase [Arcobacteraceae bacterium]